MASATFATPPLTHTYCCCWLSCLDTSPGRVGIKHENYYNGRTDVSWLWFFYSFNLQSRSVGIPGPVGEECDLSTGFSGANPFSLQENSIPNVCGIYFTDRLGEEGNSGGGWGFNKRRMSWMYILEEFQSTQFLQRSLLAQWALIRCQVTCRGIYCFFFFLASG